MANLLKVYNKLSTTQNIILNSVKSFCADYLKPRVIQDYKNEVVDRNIFLEMETYFVASAWDQGWRKGRECRSTCSNIRSTMPVRIPESDAD